ncbi:MAG: class I SAM-dependent methyltransferase [Candidatus Eisenbacteria bacterium]|nr:class I SAM-dependent methyltransferase [Candidatus Eisenbacteria bacterium]
MSLQPAGGKPRRWAGGIIRRLAPGFGSRREFDRYVRQWVLPPDLPESDLSSFRPRDRIGHGGIDLRPDEQLALLARWKTSRADLFRSLREDPRINTRCPGQDRIHNGTYPTPDAEIYAAMILDHRPPSIVEIGAGYSTMIARKVSSEHGLQSRITVIDPEPRADVRGHADVIINRRVEEIGADHLPLDGGALLFIDSSHIARARGDIPQIYNKILPSVPAGTLVHVHDVFIPYDYPFLYQKRLYTEQYVLHALLAHSRRYRVVMATHFLSREHTSEMQAVFGPAVGTDDLYWGASLWFQVE